VSHCDVRASDGMCCELTNQVLLSLDRACEHEQAAGVAIQSMDGPQVLAPDRRRERRQINVVSLYLADASQYDFVG